MGWHCRQSLRRGRSLRLCWGSRLCLRRGRRLPRHRGRRLHLSLGRRRRLHRRCRLCLCRGRKHRQRHLRAEARQHHVVTISISCWWCSDMVSEYQPHSVNISCNISLKNVIKLMD